MKRLVQFVLCPGCGRELCGSTDEDRRRRYLTHARNCQPYRKLLALADVNGTSAPAEADVPQTEAAQ